MANYGRCPAIGCAEDCVDRLMAFRARQPDVDVVPPGRDTGSLWTAHLDGKILSAQYWLGDLLDDLDVLL